MRRRRVIALVLLILVFLGASFLLQDVFDDIVHALAAYEQAHPISGPMLFILLAAASVMLGPFTSAPLMPFAIGVWGTWQTLWLLLIGWAVGNTAAYGIGYFFGHPLVSLIVPASDLRKWIRFLREEVSMWGIFLFRLVVPAEIGYAFGILKYDFRKYLAIVLLAELPFALIVVYGGEAYIDGRWALVTGYVAATITLMGGAWLIFRARR